MTLTSPILADIAIDVAYLAELINKICKQRKLDGYDFQEAVLLLCYRLVHFCPIDEPRATNDLHRLCQLTLITFITTLLLEYGRNPARYNLLSGNLGITMRQTTILGTNASFVLWCIFVGGIAVFYEDDDQWMQPPLSRICRQLEVSSWAEELPLVTLLPVRLSRPLATATKETGQRRDSQKYVYGMTRG
jgi:hypothetical protein